MAKSKRTGKQSPDTYPKSGKQGDLDCLKHSTVKSADTASAGAMADQESRSAAQDAVKGLYTKK